MTLNQKPESLDDLLDQAKRYAEFSMRYSGRVPTTLLLLGPSGPGIYVPRNLDDEQAKNDFAAVARRMAIAHDATAVVMVVEAWARRATSDVPLDLTIPPSQAPDRQEVVSLVGEALGLQKVTFLPIRRTATGAFSGFGPDCVQNFNQMQGRFAEILPAQTPTSEEKASAQAILRAQGIKQTTPTCKPVSAPKHWHRV